MARYYLDPEIRITNIIEDSKVGVWLTPHGEGVTVPMTRELFLGTVRGGQDLGYVFLLEYKTWEKLLYECVRLVGYL